MSQFFVGTTAGGLPPSVPTTFHTDNGDAIPAGNILNIFATDVPAAGIPAETTGSGNTVTVDIQLASAIDSLTIDKSPYPGLASFNNDEFTVVNGFVSLVGSEVEPAIKGIDVDATSGTGTDPVFSDGTGILQMTGAQALAGTINNTIETISETINSLTIAIQRSSASGLQDARLNGVCHFDSSDFTVNSNGYVSLVGTGAGETITGNSGGAISPIANNWNLVTANSTPKFVGNNLTATITLDFALSNLIFGSSLPALTSGVHNTSVGNGAMASTTSASYNIAIGETVLANATSAQQNTAVGVTAMQTATTSADNVAVGYAALNAATTGTGRNISIGSLSAPALLTGSQNIMIGYNVGVSYVGAESSNILLSNSGTAAESNVIRIGTQGSGAGQQTDCYLAGVLHTTSGRTVNITTPGAYPYTTLTTDYVILVDSSSARTITPLGSPTTGTTYVIKDNVGSAAANNITITPSGKNIDGSASFVITTNYGSATIVYNGTQWNVI